LFYIDVHEFYLDKEVHISALGFEDAIISTKTIYQNKKVYLQRRDF